MSFLAREHTKKGGVRTLGRSAAQVPVPVRGNPAELLSPQPESHQQVSHALSSHAPQAIRAGSAEEVVAAAILPGERVLAFAPCLRRIALQLFEKMTVVVTDQRLLLVAPGFPWGHELKEIHPRNVCSILTGKERKDGSRLLVVSIGKGSKLCLYFSRSRQQESDDVLNAIRQELIPVDEVDRGSLEHEFSALALPHEDEEEQD